jgi:3-dehydroquinate synthase
VVGAGVLKNLEEHLKRAGLRGPFLIVTQPRIFRALRSVIPKTFPVFLIPDGERAKDLSTVSRILRKASDLRMTRQSTIIAVGGGVVGDVAGFAAAIYMRGIPVVQAPTTLLAQVDSSIGGKTGVNLRFVKNLVGAFHQPSLVLCDTGALKTLPQREYSSGLYEALKYGVICDRELFNLFEKKRRAIIGKEAAIVEELVARCAAIKGDIVARDEREGDLRRVLNLGHTVGHGLETAAGLRRLKHGEAVGFGMIAASRISAALGRMPPAEAERVESAVLAIGKLPSLKGVRLSRVLDAVMHDKKVRDGAIHFVLPLAIGRVEVTPDVPLDLVRDVSRRLIDEHKAAR